LEVHLTLPFYLVKTGVRVCVVIWLELLEGQSTIKILNFTNCSSTIFLKI
jgi:hypothetical protein